MAIEEQVLRTEINRAVTLSGIDSPQAGITARDRLVENLSVAVEHYVLAKLTALKVKLATPGTFVGAGTGTVVVTAPGMASYNP